MKVLNLYSTSRLAIPVIAVICLLATTVFAPDTQARGRYEPTIPAIELGTAANYKVFAGAAITAPNSAIYGSIAAGAAITVHNTFVTGNTYAKAAVTPSYGGSYYSPEVDATRADLEMAWNDASNRTKKTIILSGDLAGRTLKPGHYHFNEAISLGGSTQHLTLDAEYNSNAVFLFTGDAAMNTSAGRRIILINLADSNRVFWKIDGAITAGANTVLRGIFMTKAAITLGANTETHGALLSLDAAVTIDSGIVI
jgi:hypothetical protein